MSLMQLAITKDTAEIIGPFAEAVENRSLLLDKFVCHKRWPLESTDDASRWSFMRVAENGSALLNRDAQNYRRQANGRNTTPENMTKYSGLAQIAEQMAKNAFGRVDTEMQQIQSQHAARLLSLLKQSRFESKVLVGKLESRLAINLADGLIQNAGIALHRLFGLPYIPGSAVKGITRAVALKALLEADAHAQSAKLKTFIAVFGTSKNDFKVKSGDLGIFSNQIKESAQDQKGAVSFLPAYALDKTKVVVDITNVHTPDYYRSGAERDLSQEKPRPNPFPAVEAGSRFAFGLVLNGTRRDNSLLDQAARWLTEALETNGIGAKTAAGYGWFNAGNSETETSDLMQAAKAQAEKLEREQSQAVAEQKARDEREKRRAQMAPEELKADDLWQEIHGKAEEIKALITKFANLGDLEKKAVLHLCRNQAKLIWATEHAEYAKLLDNPKKQDKSKAFKRVKTLLEAAKAMGEIL